MSSSRRVRILSSCRIPHEFPWAQPLLLRESLGSLLKRLRALAEHRKHSLDHGLITSITQRSKCSASSNSTWTPGVLSPSRTTDVSGDRQGWHVSDRYSATVPRLRCSFTPPLMCIAGVMPMSDNESFSNSIFLEQTHLAERGFHPLSLRYEICAAQKRRGFRRRTGSMSWNLWIAHLDPRARNWRAVTIAAWARLANRVNASAASGKLARQIGN